MKHSEHETPLPQHQDTRQGFEPTCGCEKLRKALEQIKSKTDVWTDENGQRFWSGPVQRDVNIIATEALAQPCQPVSAGREEWTVEEVIKPTAVSGEPDADSKFETKGWAIIASGKELCWESDFGSGFMFEAICAAHNAALRRQSAPAVAVGNSATGADACVVLQAELEQAKERLWSIGLLPSHYDTLPKAVEAAVRMVATLRETIHDPPCDLQQSVIAKLDLVSRDALTALQRENAELKGRSLNYCEEEKTLQQRLDKAEQDSRRLDWLEALLPPEEPDKVRRITMVCFLSALRATIDAALAAQAKEQA